MALFTTDIAAFIFILVLIILLVFSNRVITYFTLQSKRISAANKNKITFTVRVLSVILCLYFIMEGFPSFELINSTYLIVITGSISTAVAIASSDIFSNLVAGFVLMITDPFDIGDVVKIHGDKGIIRQISLTKVVMETFDNVIIEKPNNSVTTAIVINYTTKLRKIKKYVDFKKKIQSPQDKGISKVVKQSAAKKKQAFVEMRRFFETFSEKLNPDLHTYTFRMEFPYVGFHIMVDKVQHLCEMYKDKFGFKPRFHIMGFTNRIIVKFRLLTLDSNILLQYQPVFAKDIYKIILAKREA